MALNSTCPKCEHTGFETVIEEPKNSKVKIIFIRCSSCGCVVGTQPYFVTARLLNRIAEKIGIHDLLS